MAARIPAQVDVTALMIEVQRYLAAVEVFRAEGREPRWLPEDDAANDRRR
jgi:hypothetical protein